MQGRALVFGMVLYADEPRMVLHFDRFDQIGVRIDADRFQAGPNELVEVVVVELVAVAMTLDDVLAAVCEVGNVILERLGEGYSVELDGFGDFYLSAGSEGYENPKDCTPHRVKARRVCFRMASDVRKGMKFVKFERRLR